MSKRFNCCSLPTVVKYQIPVYQNASDPRPIGYALVDKAKIQLMLKDQRGIVDSEVEQLRIILNKENNGTVS